MEVLVPWVSPAICALLFVGCLGFYLDSKGARAALAAWQAATETQLGEHGAQLIDHAARLLILEGGGQPPPAGSAPPSSEPRPTYLELMTELSDAELARVDAAAARRGVTREAMYVILARTALDEAEAAARLPAATTPPSAPANDRAPLPDGDGDEPPPPNGKHRG